MKVWTLFCSNVYNYSLAIYFWLDELLCFLILDNGFFPIGSWDFHAFSCSSISNSTQSAHGSQNLQMVSIKSLSGNKANLQQGQSNSSPH
jgi:hypothetical protein